MRIQVAVPEEHVDAPVLNAALEATTRLDESLIKSGEVPLFREAKNRVRWKPEPPGQEHFDHAKLVLGRGDGDCDDLAPWHAASLRATGQDPGARAVVKKSGANRWHALVQRSDGRIEDPSRAAGMPGPGSTQVSGWGPGCVHGIRGAVVRPMTLQTSVVGGTYIEKPALAVRPLYDQAGQPEAWQARADLPWHWKPTGKGRHDLAMVSLHRSPIASQAVVGAINGMLKLGMHQDRPINEHHMKVLGAVADALEGASYMELCGIYGVDVANEARHVVGQYVNEVGSIFTKAFKGIKNAAKTVAKVANPILKNKYVQMAAAAGGQAFGIPAPATMAAMNAASKGLAMINHSTGKAVKVTPAQAASSLAQHGYAHFVNPKTKKPLHINVPNRTGVTLKPGAPPPKVKPVAPGVIRPSVTNAPAPAIPADASASWQPSSRTPIHPSMLPTSFTLHVTPIP